MEIENAKQLLIAIKDQISKNLPDKEKKYFLDQFNSLIKGCPNYSKAYSAFCIQLLTRYKCAVRSEDLKNIIKSIDDIIILFKSPNSTKQQLKAAADAAYVAYAAAYAAYAAAYADAAAAYAATAATAAAYAAAWAADTAYAAYADAAAAYAYADAAAYAAASRKEEYQKQSIDLINALKKRGRGRPKGSVNKIKSEPKKALPKVPLSKWDRCLEAVKKIVGVK